MKSNKVEIAIIYIRNGEGRFVYYTETRNNESARQIAGELAIAGKAAVIVDRYYGPVYSSPLSF